MDNIHKCNILESKNNEISNNCNKQFIALIMIQNCS